MRNCASENPYSQLVVMDSGPAPYGASRNDDLKKQTNAFPRRRCVRVDATTASSVRGGRRECRVFGCTRSLVCNSKKHTSVFTTGTGRNIDIPCAMVLTAYCVLTPERPGFVVSVACGMSRPQTWHLPLGRRACTPLPSAKCCSSARKPRAQQPASIASRFLRS
jgi:hypothetical protein